MYSFALSQLWSYCRFRLSQQWSNCRFTLSQQWSNCRFMLSQQWSYCRFALSQQWSYYKFVLCQQLSYCRLRSHWYTYKWLSIPATLNTSPLGQNGHHFTDDSFKCIFVNEKFPILIKISLKFVPEGPIDNSPALVLIMTWCRIGTKPLSEPMLTWFTDAYMQH